MELPCPRLHYASSSGIVRVEAPNLERANMKIVKHPSQKRSKAKKAPKKLPAKGSVRYVAAKCPMPPREPPLPTGTRIAPLHVHEDARGKITNVLSRPLGSYAVIESNKGTVRAEHWHKKDWHFCWVAEGKILYFERPVGSDELPKVTTVTKGQMFFTGPNLEHSMYFMEDTVFTCLGRLSRKQEDYETDLVRLEKKLTDIPMIRATYIDPPTDMGTQDMPGSIQ